MSKRDISPRLYDMSVEYIDSLAPKCCLGQVGIICVDTGSVSLLFVQSRLLALHKPEPTKTRRDVTQQLIY